MYAKMQCVLVLIMTNLLMKVCPADWLLIYVLRNEGLSLLVNTILHHSNYLMHRDDVN